MNNTCTCFVMIKTLSSHSAHGYQNGVANGTAGGAHKLKVPKVCVCMCVCKCVFVRVCMLLQLAAPYIYPPPPP